MSLGCDSHMRGATAVFLIRVQGIVTQIYIKMFDCVKSQLALKLSNTYLKTVKYRLLFFNSSSEIKHF